MGQSQHTGVECRALGADNSCRLLRQEVQGPPGGLQLGRAHGRRRGPATGFQNRQDRQVSRETGEADWRTTRRFLADCRGRRCWTRSPNVRAGDLYHHAAGNINVRKLHQAG